jgi:iron complex outermembrane receptor protein
VAPSPQGHPPYKAEKLTAYETGLKTMSFNDHLRTNLTGFFYNYKDWQASFRVPGQNLPRSQNMPEVEAYGGELEAQAAFGGWRADANVGYTHSEVTKGPASPLIVPAGTFGPNLPAAAPVTTFNPEGLPLNYSPQWTYNAAVEYDIPIGAGSLTPRLQYSYIGGQWVQLYHASQDFFPAHHLLDFRLAYRAPEHWRVEGFVTNLTNELYVTGVVAGPVATPYINSLALGPPRQVGVRIQYEF